MPMQNSVNVTVEFWQVKMPAGINLETVLQEIENLPDNEQRNVTKANSQPVRMTRIQQNGAVWSGDMVKIRMDYLPSKASIKGDLEPLELEDDEGIGEENAFIFHPTYNVLLMQRNRHGVSASLFAYYISRQLTQLMNITESVEFLPVVRPEGVDKLDKFFEIKKFDVGFAYSGSMKDTIESDSVNAGILMLENLQSLHGSFIFSMGRKRGGMSVKEVIKAIKALYSSEQVTKLKITGHSSDSPEESSEFDVLEYRLKFKGVLLTNERRELTYEQRSNLISQAMREKDIEIKQIIQ